MYLDSCVTLLEGCRGIGLAGAAMILERTCSPRPPRIALQNAGLQWVQITLDGDNAEHDRSRITIRWPGNVRTRSWASRGGVGETALKCTCASSSTATRSTAPMRWSGASPAGRPWQDFMMTSSLIYDVGLGYPENDAAFGGLGHRLADLHRQAIDAGFTVGAPRVGRLPVLLTRWAARPGAVVNSDGSLYSCYQPPDSRIRPGFGSRRLPARESRRRAG